MGIYFTVECVYRYIALRNIHKTHLAMKLCNIGFHFEVSVQWNLSCRNRKIEMFSNLLICVQRLCWIDIMPEYTGQRRHIRSGRCDLSAPLFQLNSKHRGIFHIMQRGYIYVQKRLNTSNTYCRRTPEHNA